MGKVRVTDTLFYNVLHEYTSDQRLKKDIRNLAQNYVSKIMQLQGVKYKYKHPSELNDPQTVESDTANNDLIAIDSPKYTSDHIGFIAQEVQQVYPELVCEHPNGNLGLNKIDLIPIMVEAIKEQQAMIENLQSRISALEPESSNLKGDLIASTENLSSSFKSAELFQNNPNPFSSETQIRYRIPEEVNKSKISLYDLQGKQIKSYNIVERGISNITIQGYELDPGIYLYTLIVDGKEIGTKRMILTD